MTPSGFKEKVLKVLREIKGSGSFVSTGTKSFIFPGMEIMGVGEIGFPVSEIESKEIIKVAHKAPFGKGSETVINLEVRSGWEIDANKITFINNEWGKFIDEIIEQIKPELGIQEYHVTANLYKLLIYEKGDFFLTHKDSEKEMGMFGTLIIGLPTKHTGGELIVKFDGRAETIDFSEPSRQYQIPYAAFYADCDHEIKPVTSGYRICLTYNLVQNKSEKQIQLHKLDGYAHQLAEILKESENDQIIPKIVLLGHQYTPSNYTIDSLKLNDRPKAEALILASEKAGYYVKLGLVTSYVMGQLLGDGGYRNYRKGRYNDYEELTEDGEMGEVYDEYVSVENWMDYGVPALGDIKFEAEDIISANGLNVGEPIEKHAEGYTGNAGMEMTYWYHYGAVFLWPKKYQFDLLNNISPAYKIAWIAYYNVQWNLIGKYEIYMIKKLIEIGFDNLESNQHLDISPLADFLTNIKDEKYLRNNCIKLLKKYFKDIQVESWLRLFSAYPASCFAEIFTQSGMKLNKTIFNHLLSILEAFKIQEQFTIFVDDQIDSLPIYLCSQTLAEPGESTITKEIIQKVLLLGASKDSNEAWLNDTCRAILRSINRNFVNEVLLDVILSYNNQSVLVQLILAECKIDLNSRVDNKPQPPKDWSRPTPKNGNNKEIWDILADFLESPSQQVFDYKKSQEFRSAMECAIRQVSIDLNFETIKEKSPYTLRLTKTQAKYERDMANWREDVELLGKVKGFY